MVAPLEELAVQSLKLLEWRLQRLEFFLTGDVAPEDGKKQVSISTRVRRLEDAMQKLASDNRIAHDALSLHARYGDILYAREQGQEDLETAEKLAMVLTEAPSYPSTASQLTSLHDLSVPPTSFYTSLVSLLPRMEQIQSRQMKQAAELSALRKRSAALILRWHEISILAQGRCWAEWDSKLRKSERKVRREEIRREHEAG